MPLINKSVKRLYVNGKPILDEVEAFISNGEIALQFHIDSELNGGMEVQATREANKAMFERYQQSGEKLIVSYSRKPMPEVFSQKAIVTDVVIKSVGGYEHCFVKF